MIASAWAAWRIQLGLSALVALRPSGWASMCGLCEVESPATDEEHAGWLVWQHNGSIEHAVMVAVELRG